MRCCLKTQPKTGMQCPHIAAPLVPAVSRQLRGFLPHGFKLAGVVKNYWDHSGSSRRTQCELPMMASSSLTARLQGSGNTGL